MRTIFGMGSDSLQNKNDLIIKNSRESHILVDDFIDLIFMLSVLCDE